MGDAADDAMFEALCHEFDHEQAIKRIEEYAKSIIEDYKMGIAKWTKKDKTTILVTDMSDNHVKATLALLKRNQSNSSILAAWIKVFNAEIIKRKL